MEITDIIVLGANGRMGKIIVELAQREEGFRLAGAVDCTENIKFLKNLPCPASDDLESILKQASNGVIIDFTAPIATVNAARLAEKYGMPMVIGTTGIDGEQKRQLSQIAKHIPILWSSNMSIGINVLMEFLPMLAKALGKDYDMEMVELHHKRKKDSPSGTALMLGESLANSRGWNLDDTRCSERNGIIGERKEREIGIQALRGGDVVGMHKIYFLGPGEIIEVAHTAESRENFARGALRAASWLRDKTPGKLYTMKDVINLEQTGIND